MSIVSEIENITTARNTIRNKMRAVGQATSTDKLSSLASNLNILDTSDANATAANIDSGKTAYVNGTKLTGTSTKTDTSDANATADDILSGKTAYVNGNKLTGTSNNVDTSDATATADDILSGKTAYVNGSKVTGTVTTATMDEIRVAIIESRNFLIKPFATATDKQITKMLNAVRNGDISISDLGWSVGDERKVHLSAMAATGVGESHVEQDQTLVILHGSDVFDLVDGGKNLFVIGLKNVLANGTNMEGGYINSSNTNVGGWKESARRPWCDNVFMPALPTEVQKWFKKFKYLAGKGNKSTEVDTLENFFTFASMFEAFGNNDESAAENTVQFDYYKTTANRIKYSGDNGGSANSWWLRSANTNFATLFRYVYTNGNDNSIKAFNTYGLSPFGCV